MNIFSCLMCKKKDYKEIERKRLHLLYKALSLQEKTFIKNNMNI